MSLLKQWRSGSNPSPKLPLAEYGVGNPYRTGAPITGMPGFRVFAASGRSLLHLRDPKAFLSRMGPVRIRFSVKKD